MSETGREGEPIALAYDDAADGELIAKLYTLEVVAMCEDSWWIRVEYTDEAPDELVTEADQPGGDGR